MNAKKVNAPGFARLPVFCHAVVAGDFIYVSGTLGTKPGSMELAEGGTGPETAQALQNIDQILKECGASLADVGKAQSDELRDAPVEGWHGPEDDDELIAYMLAARDKASDAFAPPGTPSRFEALWYGDAAYLSVKFPPKEADEVYDKTAADLALANELAYYTGSHGERCLALFERSELAQRASYETRKGVRAISRACSGRTMHHFMRRTPAVSAQPQQAPSSMDSTTGVRLSNIHAV